MKCHIEKIGQFLENDSIDQDIRDFVYKVYKTTFKECYNDDIKFLFMDLGFYELSKEDESEYDTADTDYQVLDFHKLLKLSPKLRKLVLKHLYSDVAGKTSSNFFDEFLEETKLKIQYEKWKKVRRKNKLMVLNGLNINELNK